jgi:hypothetical protein
MFCLNSKKTAIILPLALLSVAVATPAAAGNWFGIDPVTGMRRHIGSAPNPTPQDIRENRKAINTPNMSLLMKEQGSMERKMLLESEETKIAVAIENAGDAEETAAGKAYSAASIR